MLLFCVLFLLKKKYLPFRFQKGRYILCVIILYIRRCRFYAVNTWLPPLRQHTGFYELRQDTNGSIEIIVKVYAFKIHVG